MTLLALWMQFYVNVACIWCITQYKNIIILAIFYNICWTLLYPVFYTVVVDSLYILNFTLITIRYIFENVVL